MSTTAMLRAKHIAEAIENCAMFSDEKHPTNVTIEVELRDSQVIVTGWSLYSACIDRRPTEAFEGDGAKALIDYSEAQELIKSGLRKMDGFGKKDSMASLSVSHDGIELRDGENVIGAVKRSQDASVYEAESVQDMDPYGFLKQAAEAPSLPGELRKMRFLRDVMPRLGANKLKVSSFEDGKWVALGMEDPMDFEAIADRVVRIKYGSVCILQVNAGIVELDEQEGL